LGDKRCEYSNYFKLRQTSFQTGVDKYYITSCLTNKSLSIRKKELKIVEYYCTEKFKPCAAWSSNSGFEKLKIE
jgi:hypothetical protein